MTIIKAFDCRISKKSISSFSCTLSLCIDIRAVAASMCGFTRELSCPATPWVRKPYGYRVPYDPKPHTFRILKGVLRSHVNASIFSVNDTFLQKWWVQCVIICHYTIVHSTTLCHKLAGFCESRNILLSEGNVIAGPDMDAACRGWEALFSCPTRPPNCEMGAHGHKKVQKPREKENQNTAWDAFAPAPPEHRRRKRWNSIFMLR